MLFGGSPATTSITGGAGDDLITGGNGDDTINGSERPVTS